ncbi:MAG: hypothetical protein VX002_06150, partial [Bacteroidota bacterium]|nr:hypothetical protein [Bacteroidota bacterium]
MNRFQSLWMTLALCGLSLQTSAQITYGGSPWPEGERPEAVTMPAIDRATLAAEDAVTDRYKEAPWRFGVEHEMALNPVEHGVWTVERGHRVWRLALAAEGATSLSLRFDTYRVPKGGQMFVYAADGSDVLGALDHRNMKEWGGLAVGVIAADE